MAILPFITKVLVMKTRIQAYKDIVTKLKQPPKVNNATVKMYLNLDLTT